MRGPKSAEPAEPLPTEEEIAALYQRRWTNATAGGVDAEPTIQQLEEQHSILIEVGRLQLDLWNHEFWEGAPRAPARRIERRNKRLETDGANRVADARLFVKSYRARISNPNADVQNFLERTRSWMSQAGKDGRGAMKWLSEIHSAVVVPPAPVPAAVQRTRIGRAWAWVKRLAEETLVAGLALVFALLAIFLMFNFKTITEKGWSIVTEGFKHEAHLVETIMKPVEPEHK